MATKTFSTNAYQGRYLKLTLTQKLESIDWKLESIGGSSSYYSIYGCKVSIDSTVVYQKDHASYTTQTFPAATGSKSGTVYIGKKAKSVKVIFTGSVYNTDTSNTDYGGTFSFEATVKIPEIAEPEVTSITSTSAKAEWEFESLGYPEATTYGLRLYNSSKVVIKTAAGKMSNTFTGLSANTKYYVASYAENSAGSVSSFLVEFTTKSTGTSIKPTIGNFKIDLITTTSARCSFRVIDSGSSAVTESNIKLYNSNNTIIETVSGREAIFTDLRPCAFYYVEFLAKNNAGTTTSSKQTFQTKYLGPENTLSLTGHNDNSAVSYNALDSVLRFTWSNDSINWGNFIAAVGCRYTYILNGEYLGYRDSDTDLNYFSADFDPRGFCEISINAATDIIDTEGNPISVGWNDSLIIGVQNFTYLNNVTDPETAEKILSPMTFSNPIYFKRPKYVYKKVDSKKIYEPLLKTDGKFKKVKTYILSKVDSL